MSQITHAACTPYFVSTTNPYCTGRMCPITDVRTLWIGNHTMLKFQRSLTHTAQSLEHANNMSLLLTKIHSKTTEKAHQCQCMLYRLCCVSQISLKFQHSVVSNPECSHISYWTHSPSTVRVSSAHKIGGTCCMCYLGHTLL